MKQDTETMLKYLVASANLNYTEFIGFSLSQKDFKFQIR